MTGKIFVSISILVFVACNSISNKEQKENKIEPTLTSADTSQAGCDVCLIEKKLKRLISEKSLLTNSNDSVCAFEHLKIIEKNIDSLNNEIINLKRKFNLTDHQQDVSYKAEAACSKLFPINHIRDTLKRDSLLYALRWWNNEHTPIFDTICNKIPIINSKFALKIKGKGYYLSKEELTNYINTIRKMEEMKESRIFLLVSELCGLKSPNESCIEIMIRYANYRESKIWRNPPKVIAGYKDPDFKKLYESLDKFD